MGKLTNCSSNAEATLLISYLEASGIDATTKYTQSGSYLNILHGFNYQGVDVIVADEQLEEAKVLLETFEYSDEDFDSEMMSDELSYNKKRKRNVRLLVLLMLCIPMILVLILAYIN